MFTVCVVNIQWKFQIIILTKIGMNVIRSVYLSGCSHMTCNSDVDRKPGFKGTGTCTILLFTNVIGFEVKNPRETALRCLMNQQNLMKQRTSRQFTVEPHRRQSSILCLTWTRWHCIKLCMCVKIRSTMCSIVLCSSNIIRAKSNRTWFRFTSKRDFS